MVDLPGINMAQMVMEGIREDQIFWINLSPVVILTFSFLTGEKAKRERNFLSSELQKQIRNVDRCKASYPADLNGEKENSTIDKTRSSRISF